MKLFKILKERRLRSGQKRSNRMKRSWDLVGGTSSRDRLLADQGTLIQNADTLGGVVSDGLNRFV